MARGRQELPEGPRRNREVVMAKQHLTESDLRVIVPAMFPLGRPCRSLGHPEWYVSLLEGPVGMGRIRMCSECKRTVEAQAAEAKITVTAEPIR